MLIYITCSVQIIIFSSLCHISPICGEEFIESQNFRAFRTFNNHFTLFLRMRKLKTRGFMPLTSFTANLWWGLDQNLGLLIPSLKFFPVHFATSQGGCDLSLPPSLHPSIPPCSFRVYFCRELCLQHILFSCTCYSIKKRLILISSLSYLLKRCRFILWQFMNYN